MNSMNNQNLQGVNPNNLSTGTMIQPPIHVTIPAVAKWFNQDQVHEIQKKEFPEFFKDQINNNNISNNDIFSFSVKNINLYLYYRNSIISMWRQNSKKYLSGSLCRKNLLGDVSSIMRIHAFLQNWGLINFPSKQHQKGKTIQNPQVLNCYICQSSTSKIYYLTQIQQSTLFQICQHCFQENLYPLWLKRQDFRKIYLQNHLSSLHKQMDRSQIIKMLQIMNNIPNINSKDKDIWGIIQKQFPDHTKQQLLKIFIKLPLTNQMNSNIFENNQDILYIENQQIKKQILSIKQPSIFEDYQNPIQASIAMNYYQWKHYQKINIKKEEINGDIHMNNNNTNQEKQQKQKQQQKQQKQKQQQKQQKQYYQQQQQQLSKYNLLTKIFNLSLTQCKFLVQDQQTKIIQLTKMLIQVILSKLQLKNLFISQYQKFIKAEQQLSHNTMKNVLADNLKHNLRVIYQREKIINSNINGSVGNDNININDNVDLNNRQEQKE